MVTKDATHLSELVTREGADMLLLQETKLQEGFVPEYKDMVPGYFGWWSCSKTKKVCVRRSVMCMCTTYVVGLWAFP